jgi:hypothetical protein
LAFLLAAIEIHLVVWWILDVVSYGFYLLPRLDDFAPSFLLALGAVVAGRNILLNTARGWTLIILAIAMAWRLPLRALSDVGWVQGSMLLGYAICAVYVLWPKTPVRVRVSSGPLSPDQDNWREWLLTSLSDPAVKATPDRFFLTVFYLVFYIVVFFTWQTLARASPPQLVLLLSVIGLLLIGPFIFLLKKRYMQAKAESAVQELERSGQRRPILYLRAFEHDRYANKAPLLNYVLTVSLPTAEQRVVNVLRRYGPVIAIGRPKERLPELGAARFYVDDAHWQAKVADVARVSQLVVWMTGTSPGLKWEIAHLIEKYPPQQIILWAHPWLYPGDAEEREQQWQQFRETMGSAFPRPLPDKLGSTRFIHFDAQFNPIAVTQEGGRSADQTALARLLADKGATPAPRWRARKQAAAGDRPPGARLARAAMLAAAGGIAVAGATFALHETLAPGKPVWRLLHDESRYTLTGHQNLVRSLTVTPDGKLLLSSSQDQTIKMWTLADRREVRSIPASYTTYLAVTPDGRTLVASADTFIKVLDLASGRELRSFKAHTNSIYGVVITPDGRSVVTGSSDDTIRIWDLANGRELRRISAPGYTELCLSPDGRYLVAGGIAAPIKVWDLAGGRELRTLSGHSDWIGSIVVTPDSRQVVSASADKTLKVWDLASGRELRTLSGHTERVVRVAVTPDGMRVISGGTDTSVKIWDLASGRELRSFSGHSGAITAMAVTPDGDFVITGGTDKTIKFWPLREP